MTTWLRVAVREVKRTFGRFLALFVLAALTTGIFSGLRMSAADFTHTVNRFYSKAKMYDYRITSSLNWDETSIKTISGRDDVSAAEGVWRYDVLVGEEEDPAAYRVCSLEKKINKVTLTEGALPNKENECLVDADNRMGLKVGDTLKLSAANSDTAKRAFTATEWQVTGFGRSPLFITSERGGTSIGDGRLDGFIYVTRETFTAAEASLLDIKLDDSSRAMTQVYQKMMDNKREEWTTFVTATATDQAERMKKVAEKELAEAKEVFKKTQQEINKKLKPDRDKLERQKAGLDSRASALEAQKQSLDDEEDSLPDMERKVKEALAKYKSAKEEEREKYQQAYEKIKEAYDQERDGIKSGRQQYQSAMYSLDAGYAEYNNKLAVFNKKEAELNKGLIEPRNRVNAAQKKLNGIREPQVSLLERDDDETFRIFRRDIRLGRQATAVIPFLILAAAALLAALLAARRSDKENRHISLSHSLGASRTALMTTELTTIGCACLLGGLVGQLVGTAAVPRLIWRAYEGSRIDMVLETEFGFAHFALAMCVQLVCALGADAWVMRRLLNRGITPLLRGETHRKGRRLLIHQLGDAASRVPAFIRQALRRVLLYHRRLAVGVIGIGLSTVILLTGLGLKDSVAGLSRTQYESIQIADAEVSFYGGKAGEVPGKVINGVTRIGAKAMPFVNSEWTLHQSGKKRDVTLIAPYGNATFSHFFLCRDPKDRGLALPGEGEALVSLGLAKTYQIKKGSTIRLTDAGEHEMKLKVKGIFTNYIGDYVIASPAAVQAACESANVNRIFVNFSKEMKTKDGLAALSVLQGATSVRSASQNKQRVAGAVAEVRGVARVTIFAAILLVIAMVLVTAQTQAKERRRECEIYRSLGFDRAEAAQPLRVEHWMLAMLGTFIGILAGLALHHMVIARFIGNTIYIPEHIGLLSYFCVIAVAAGSTILTNILTRRQVAKIYEEADRA